MSVKEIVFDLVCVAALLYGVISMAGFLDPQGLTLLSESETIHR